MAEKVTTMVIKVDLQCPCCYRKIKKILCKYPQIRDQVYNEKANTVTVTAVNCIPEKMRDKLYSRGGKVIKSIEIKEPAKPKEPEKKKEPDKPKETPKEPEKPKEKPKVVVVEPEKPKGDGGKPQDKPKEAPKPKGDGGKPQDKPKEDQKPKGDGGKPQDKGPAPPPEPVKLPPANLVTGIPPVHPAMAYYGPSYDGFGGPAPWYNGYGVPPPPPPVPTYDGYYGYGPQGGYGYPRGRGYNLSNYDSYFSEENPSACSIM